MEAMEVDNFGNEPLEKTTDFSSLGFNTLNSAETNLEKEVPMDIPAEENHIESHVENDTVFENSVPLENHSNGNVSLENKHQEDGLEDEEKQEEKDESPEETVNKPATEIEDDQKSDSAEEESNIEEPSESNIISGEVDEETHESEKADNSDEAHELEKAHDSEKGYESDATYVSEKALESERQKEIPEESESETKSRDIDVPDDDDDREKKINELVDAFLAKPIPIAKPITPKKHRRKSHREDAFASEDESGADSPRKLSSRVRKKPEKLEYSDSESSPKKISTESADVRTSLRNVRKNRSSTEATEDDKNSESESDVPLSKTLKRGRKKSEKLDSEVESMSSSRTSSPAKRKGGKRKIAGESEAESSSRPKRTKTITNGGWEDNSAPIQVLSPEEVQALKISPVVALTPLKQKTRTTRRASKTTKRENFSEDEVASTSNKRSSKKKPIAEEEVSPRTKRNARMSMSPPEKEITSKKESRPKRETKKQNESISIHEDPTVIRLKKIISKAGLRIRNYDKFWAGCDSKKEKISKLKDYLAENGFEASDLEGASDSEKIEEKKHAPISEEDQIGFIKIEVLRGQTQSSIRSALAQVCGESALPTSQISTIVRRFKSGKLTPKRLKEILKRKALAQELDELNTDVIISRGRRSLRSGKSYDDIALQQPASLDFKAANASSNVESDSSDEPLSSLRYKITSKSTIKTEVQSTDSESGTESDTKSKFGVNDKSSLKQKKNKIVSGSNSDSDSETDFKSTLNKSTLKQEFEIKEDVIECNSESDKESDFDIKRNAKSSCGGTPKRKKKRKVLDSSFRAKCDSNSSDEEMLADKKKRKRKRKSSSPSESQSPTTSPTMKVKRVKQQLHFHSPDYIESKADEKPSKVKVAIEAQKLLSKFESSSDHSSENAEIISSEKYLHSEKEAFEKQNEKECRKSVIDINSNDPMLVVEDKLLKIFSANGNGKGQVDEVNSPKSTIKISFNKNLSPKQQTTINEGKDGGAKPKVMSSNEAKGKFEEAESEETETQAKVSTSNVEVGSIHVFNNSKALKKRKLKLKKHENSKNRDSSEETSNDSEARLSDKSNKGEHFQLHLEDPSEENQSEQDFKSESNRKKGKILKDKDSNLSCDFNPKTKSKTKKLLASSEALSKKNIEQLLDEPTSDVEECNDS